MAIGGPRQQGGAHVKKAIRCLTSGPRRANQGEYLRVRRRIKRDGRAEPGNPEEAMLTAIIA